MKEITFKKLARLCKLNSKRIQSKNMLSREVIVNMEDLKDLLKAYRMVSAARWAANNPDMLITKGGHLPQTGEKAEEFLKSCEIWMVMKDRAERKAKEEEKAKETAK